MEINGSGSSRPQIRLSSPANTLPSLSLQRGQALSALVESVQGDGRLTLNINGRLLQAITTLPLLQGMRLQLTVEQENQQILLRLTEAEQQRLLQQQALRQVLPRQASLKALLESLGKALPTPAEATAKGADTRAAGATALPADKAVGELLRQLPAPRQLTEPQGLRQVLQHSGLFLESQLLKPPGSGYRPTQDIKGILLRLAGIIRQSLESGQGSAGARSRAAAQPQAPRGIPLETLLQLQRQSEAAVARLQVNQLGQLNPQQSAEERPLVMELPLFNPQQQELELLQLKIQREKRGQGKRQQDCWSVTLQLSPRDFGQIQAVVTLSEGSVGVTFWCAEADTRKLFQQRLEELQANLEEQGLKVGRCRANQGQLPEREDLPDVEAVGLIDIEA
jgi:hypothetical protein